MLSDDLYELCLPVLQDNQIDDDEKTETLEELLRKETKLSQKQLENTILDVLWRFRSSKEKDSSPPPSRHTIIRKASPAPWQTARTPTPSQNSPRVPPPGLVSSPAFVRTKSSTASPFTSPRASPRLALSTPHIPHSPRLDAYRFSDPSPTLEDYGDLGSDTVDSLVSDDTRYNASSFVGDAAANGAEWAQGQSMDVFDILRSILPQDKTNEELEQLLQENGYDLSATINALMGSQGLDPQQPAFIASEERTVVVGKSMVPTFRPTTPLGQQKSHILCKYYLQSGNCARADCRFSHDPSKVVCK